MPSYDYLCQKCRYRFEAFQKMSDKPLTKCPKCSGQVKRLIGGGSGLIFKGSGFYITDYKNSSEKAGVKSNADTSPSKIAGTTGEKAAA